MMDIHLCIQCGHRMGKDSALRIRIEQGLHREFMDVCRSEGKPAAQVLREFMKEYVARHPLVDQSDLFADYPSNNPE